MRKIIAAFAVSALALSAAGGVAAAKDKKSGEEQLTEMLKGRVAGTPVSCVSTWRNDNMNIIDKTAIVYHDGRTIYVNRTQNPKMLNSSDILVIKHQNGSQLCKLDQVSASERGGGIPKGPVFLTDFVPYTLPDAAG